jgi:hypothetical protein
MDNLDDRSYGRAILHIDLLGERGVFLGFPSTSQLRGKLRELRFGLADGSSVRVTYYIAAGGSSC